MEGKEKTMLSDSAKELFEKWYLNLILENRLDYNKYSDKVILAKFYRSLPSQQWGVYQDWADSIGYDVVVEPSENYNVFWYTLYDPDKNMNNKSGYTNRQEARNAAIEKLNEIINEQ